MAQDSLLFITPKNTTKAPSSLMCGRLLGVCTTVQADSILQVQDISKRVHTMQSTSIAKTVEALNSIMGEAVREGKKEPCDNGSRGNCHIVLAVKQIMAGDAMNSMQDTQRRLLYISPSVSSITEFIDTKLACEAKLVCTDGCTITLKKKESK